MASSTIRHAKAHLSDLIQAAIKGDEVIITNRGTPVVKLVRVRQSRRKPTVDEILDDLAARGEIDPPEHPWKAHKPIRVKLTGGPSIVQTVLDQRR